MRLSLQLKRVARQVWIVAAIMVAIGLFWAAQISPFPWADLRTVGLIMLVVTPLWVVVQNMTSGKKIRAQLQRAHTVTSIEPQEYQEMPIWLWVIIVVILLTCGFASPYLLLTASSLFIGMGVSIPFTLRIINEFERRGAEYYTRMNPATMRPEMLRYIPMDALEDAADPALDAPVYADEALEAADEAD